MTALVDDAVESSTRVRHTLAALDVADLHLPTEQRVKRIWSFLRDRLQFKRDPIGTEVIQTPDDLLLRIEHGATPMVDCEDVATLGATLLIAAGIPAVFILASRKPGGEFEHVFFGAMKPQGGVWPCDPQEGYGVGVWPDRITRRAIVEI